MFSLKRDRITTFSILDALICGIGMLCSAPFFYAVLVLSLGPIYGIYALVFFALWFINLNWALVGDILLVKYFSKFVCRNYFNHYFFSWQYVIIPTRRATAAAFQILVCHIFGDASSPFIVGLVLPNTLVRKLILWRIFPFEFRLRSLTHWSLRSNLIRRRFATLSHSNTGSLSSCLSRSSAASSFSPVPGSWLPIEPRLRELLQLASPIKPSCVSQLPSSILYRPLYTLFYLMNWYYSHFTLHVLQLSWTNLFFSGSLFFPGLLHDNTVFVPGESNITRLLFIFVLLVFNCLIIFEKFTINADEKSKPSQVHIFVPANDTAAAASGQPLVIIKSSSQMDVNGADNSAGASSVPLMLKRSSQAMDDGNLETAWLPDIIVYNFFF